MSTVTTNRVECEEETVPDTVTPRFSPVGMADEPAAAEPDADAQRQQDFFESGGDIMAKHAFVSAFKSSKLSRMPTGWRITAGHTDYWSGDYVETWYVHVYPAYGIEGFGVSVVLPGNDAATVLGRAYDRAVAHMPAEYRAELAAFQAKQDAAGDAIIADAESDTRVQGGAL